jgi:hypothetical protein
VRVEHGSQHRDRTQTHRFCFALQCLCVITAELDGGKALREGDKAELDGGKLVREGGRERGPGFHPWIWELELRPGDTDYKVHSKCVMDIYIEHGNKGIEEIEVIESNGGGAS